MRLRRMTYRPLNLPASRTPDIGGSRGLVGRDVLEALERGHLLGIASDELRISSTAVIARRRADSGASRLRVIPTAARRSVPRVWAVLRSAFGGLPGRAVKSGCSRMWDTAFCARGPKSTDMSFTTLSRVAVYRTRSVRSP